MVARKSQKSTFDLHSFSSKSRDGKPALSTLAVGRLRKDCPSLLVGLGWHRRTEGTLSKCRGSSPRIGGLLADLDRRRARRGGWEGRRRGVG